MLSRNRSTCSCYAMSVKHVAGSSFHVRLLTLITVIALVLLAVLATTLFHLNFLTATLLFFGVPSAYLIWQRPSNFKKAFFAAILLGVVWGFSFDYVAEFNHAWGWSTNTSLAFPIEFFGVVSLDIMIWYFLWVFFTVSFYEYFAENYHTHRISRNYIKSLAGGVFVMIFVVALSKIAPQALYWPYPYLVLGVISIIPFTYIVLRKPSLFPKVLEIAPFFIFVYLAFEITALQGDLWSFPGHYIGNVIIAGLSFPFEELIFWVVASSAFTAAYHEYYVDDLR